ncbi:Non-haem bromoperoxidase BPO-A2 [Roseibium album]|uniref:Non-haem bromoperoxidase BPO-A2 n=2 Tax=Roseibium album TaxID=311410 RepID=A0A0M7AFY4_9HYPH|nr:alpha/beta hydrolase [Roseibium album]CTQ59066.1 Non-haem bromoperoxidase BPO-A2 [Roseibium album]CTQ64086.1 Non-haem bromoperoxidase BPO-A2 [Roseibium album]CTQ73799.1 Non-haem bromoperoxidase BPO-A2 [Roseibium album]
MGPKRVEFQGAEQNWLIADRYGEGDQPVILLHGGGQTRHSWEAAAARIATLGHPVYSLDQRGHGESDWVASGTYSFEDFSKDLVAVTRQVVALHSAKPVVVGASLGGFAGMLAEGQENPGGLSALVLVDITPRIDMGGVSKIIGFMGDRVEEGFVDVEEAADAISRYLPNRTRPKDLSGLAKNLRLHGDGRYRWHWDPAFLRSRQHEDPKSSDQIQANMLVAVGNLTLPVLLIRGRNSELVSMEHVQEFLARVPHAKFTDIQDAGHMVAGDRNDVFASAVENFLLELRADAVPALSR